MSVFKTLLWGTGVGLIGALIGIFWPSTGGTAVLIVVDKGITEFRTTPEGNYFGTAVLRNMGDARAIVESLNPGCGCSQVRMTSPEIAPGQEAAIEFTVNPVAASASVVNYDLDKGTVDLAVSCDVSGRFLDQSGVKGQLKVRVIGFAPLPVTVARKACDLGDVVTSRGVVERHVSLTPQRGFGSMVAKSLTRGVVATILPAAERGNQSEFLLGLEIDPSALTAPVTANDGGATLVKLTAKMTTGGTQSVTLPLWLKVIPEISVTPSRVIAGPMLVGESEERDFFLRPDGHAVKWISDVVLLTTGASFEIASCQSDENGTRVTMKVSAVNPKLETIDALFRVQDLESGEQRTLQVPITIVAKSQWGKR